MRMRIEGIVYELVPERRPYPHVLQAVWVRASDTGNGQLKWRALRLRRSSYTHFLPRASKPALAKSSGSMTG